MPDLNMHDCFESIMKKIKKIIDRELSETGVRYPEMRIIMVIAKKKGMSQEELSTNISGVDRSNIGRALKRLESMGYIKREKSLEDGRTYQIFLTDEAVGLMEKIKATKTHIRKAFLVQGSSEELDMVLNYLYKVDEKLSEENYREIKNS